MKLPDTHNYLSWARSVNVLVHDRLKHEPPFFELCNSSLTEPTALLHEGIRWAYDHGLEDRLKTSAGWGSRPLCERLGARYDVNPDHILPATGCSAALTLVFRALVRPGDHVIIETPHYQPLAINAEDRGARVSWLQRHEPEFDIDLDALQAACTPQTKLVVLTNLHNPSGALLSDDTLRGVARIANKYGAKVVVDEVYGDFAVGPERRGPAAKLDDCMISLNSVTKVYGLGTLRCGWLMASKAVIESLRPSYAVFDVGMSHFTHTLVSMLLERFDLHEHYWQDRLSQNHPILESFIQRGVGEGLVECALPEYGGICFPRIIGIPYTWRFVQWLAAEHHVLVTPGEFFDVPGRIRISAMGAPDKLAAGLERLEEGIRAYPDR